MGVLMLIVLLTAVTGCGGTSKPISTGGGGGSAGTTPGNYAITVTGTSGTSTANAVVNFAVQ